MAWLSQMASYQAQATVYQAEQERCMYILVMSQGYGDHLFAHLAAALAALRMVMNTCASKCGN